MYSQMSTLPAVAWLSVSPVLVATSFTVKSGVPEKQGFNATSASAGADRGSQAAGARPAC
jgi:hypothetical protein